MAGDRYRELTVTPAPASPPRSGRDPELLIGSAARRPRFRFAARLLAVEHTYPQCAERQSGRQELAQCPDCWYVELIAAPEMLMHLVPRPASNSGQNVLIDDLLALLCYALEMSTLPANAQYVTTRDRPAAARGASALVARCGRGAAP
jgi:hypothetical protein